MKKNKQQPVLDRWWRYKWSGLITFAPIIIGVIVIAVLISEEQEFYSVWSCDTISNYLLDIDVPDKYPKHGDITKEQHIKLHQIYQECVDANSFMNPHA